MKVFVVLCDSCRDCNSRAIAFFSSQPTDEQIREVKSEIGGMTCIKTKVYELEEGEIVEDVIYDY